MKPAGIVPLAGFIAVNAVEPGTGRIRPIRFKIGKRRRIALRVPFLARHRTGLTADTGIKVDDQAEFLLSGLGCIWKSCHDLTPLSAREPIFMAALNRPGGRLVASNCGSDISAPPAFSMRTRRSYQAACPVTGSELE